MYNKRVGSFVFVILVFCMCRFVFVLATYKQIVFYVCNEWDLFVHATFLLIGTYLSNRPHEVLVLLSSRVC